MKAIDKLDELIKSVQDHLEKMGPVAAGALKGAAVGAVTGGIKGAATAGAAKSEELSKPPVSEAQRKAMHAAASGNSTLGIPKSVGKEFADADEGGKLPKKKKKDKAEKAADPAKPKENVLDYGAMKPPKAKEADAPGISYSNMREPIRGAGASDATFRTPKEKLAPLKSPGFRSHLSQQRAKYGVKKTEVSSEDLTKALRSKMSDQQIDTLIKTAVDKGMLHRNTLIQWLNFGTVDTELLKFASKAAVDELRKTHELDESKKDVYSEDASVHESCSKKYRDMAEKAYFNRHWKGGGYASDMAHMHDELKDHYKGIKVMDDHKLAEHQKALFEKTVALARHFMADDAAQDPHGDHNLTDDKTPNGYKA